MQYEPLIFRLPGQCYTDVQNATYGYHGWTDGSRRTSAGFGWTLRRRNNQGKDKELEWHKGCLGEFETAFDGETEA
jgi:hypothetical protein